MITVTDLKKIRGVIREEIEAESENIRSDFQSDIKMGMIRIAGELRDLNSRMKNLEIKANNIQKDLKYAVNFLDKEFLKTQKRVDRIEDHLNLSPPS